MSMRMSSRARSSGWQGIIPFYSPPAACTSRCRFCHSMAGMPLELQPRPLTLESVQAQLDASLPLPGTVIRSAEAPVESEFQAGQGAAPVEVAVYGGLLCLPVEKWKALLEIFGPALHDGRVRQLRVVVRPDQLEPFQQPDGTWFFPLETLMALGVRVIELEVPSLAPSVLERMGECHGLSHLLKACELLRQAPLVSWGICLRLGLPGSYLEQELRGAELLRELKPHFVRLQPVLVLRETWLEREMQARRYRPLTLEETLRACKRLIELLEEAQIPVIRVGIQPVKDLHLKPGAVVAGPYHPSLRSLIDAERLRERVEQRMAGRIWTGQNVRIRVAPATESSLRGPENHNLSRIKRRFRCGSLSVQVDKSLARGEVQIEICDPHLEP